MKKYVRHLFSLLMVICMMGSIVVPAAQAGDGVTEQQITGEAIVSEDNDMSRIVVNSGVRAFVGAVQVFPAVYENGSYQLYDPDITHYLSYANPNSQTDLVSISSATTQNLLSRFKAKFGRDANAWVLMFVYKLYTDGTSYGKRFEFKAVGDCIEGQSFTETLSKSDTTPGFIYGFMIPDDSTGAYNVGVWGGFYFYNASTRNEGSSMAGVKVYFNK